MDIIIIIIIIIMIMDIHWISMGEIIQSNPRQRKCVYAMYKFKTNVSQKYLPSTKIKKYIRILHSSLLVCAASPKVVQSVTSDGMTWFNQNNHCH